MTGRMNKFVVWERPAHPGLLHVAAEACVVPHIKNFGRPWAQIYCFYRQGLVCVAWPRNEFISNSVYIARNFVSADYFRRKIAVYRKLTRKMEQAVKKVGETNFTKLSNRRFLDLIREFNEVYLTWWGFAQVSEPAGAGCEELLKNSHNFSQKELSILLTPTAKSYTAQSEEELLEIVRMKLERINIERCLKNYSQKYFWTQNGYSQTFYLGPEYFRREADKIIKKGLTEERIDKIVSSNYERLANYRKEKKELIKKLKLSKYQKRLIWLIDYFADFQDKRKAFGLRINHYNDLLVKEASRRARLGYELGKFLTPNEYPQALVFQFPLAKLKARQEHFTTIFNPVKIMMFEGKNSQYKERQILGVWIQSKVNEFEGVGAMGGKARGKVRKILKLQDVKQMKKGEILVTTMTSPDLIQAIRKASAIITDEGGATCHAAIISRELGIPCVIGTKIATRILKNGDVVEVNANYGTIKVIK